MNVRKEHGDREFPKITPGGFDVILKCLCFDCVRGAASELVWKGPPAATSVCTVEQLEKEGLVGLYRVPPYWEGKRNDPERSTEEEQDNDRDREGGPENGGEPLQRSRSEGSCDQ